MTDNNVPLATMPPDDPFDLSKLRLSQDFAAAASVRKQLVTIPVRRPDRQWFVRTHPDAAYRLEAAVLELREESEIYLVRPELLVELPGEATPRIIHTAMTRQGVLFMWPIRLPDQDGKLDPWNQSALEAASLATTSWVRVASNRSLGAYDLYTASAALPEPEWPKEDLATLLKIAFKGRLIETMDHPVVRRLQGAA